MILSIIIGFYMKYIFGLNLKNKNTMKNYPHLYTPSSSGRKATSSFSNQIKTHKKTSSTVVPQYGGPSSFRKNTSSALTFSRKPEMMKGGRQSRKVGAGLYGGSRSIEQIHYGNSSRSEENEFMQANERQRALFDQNNFVEHRSGLHKMDRSGGSTKRYMEPNFGSHTPSIEGRNQNEQNVHQKEGVSTNQLFQRSYRKLDQIRHHTLSSGDFNGKPTPSIDLELNEVLELIKEEKLRANETVKSLKKTAEHYKKIYESVHKRFEETGTNTDEQIPFFKEAQTEGTSIYIQTSTAKDTKNQEDERESSGMAQELVCEFKVEEHPSQNQKQDRSPTFSKPQQFVQSGQAHIQHQEAQSHFSHQSSPKIDKKDRPQEKGNESKPLTAEEIKEKQVEVYGKLATMLEDMSIKANDILPEDVCQQLGVTFKEDKKYKELKEGEVIKIQKFFIKKLVEKIATK